jgi:hypothetical protein
MYHGRMTTLLTRREFVHAGAATLAVAQAPTMLVPGAAKPLVIASANGNKFTNGGSRAAVATAFARIVEGKDVLDAVVEHLHVSTGKVEADETYLRSVRNYDADSRMYDMRRDVWAGLSR